MRPQIVFFSYCSVSMAHFGLNELAAQADSARSSLRGSERPPEFAVTEAQTSGELLQTGSPGRDGVEASASQFNSSPRECLSTSTHMTKNLERDQDSKELLSMHTDLIEHFDMLRAQDVFKQSECQEIAQAIKTLSEIHHEMAIFLLEVGKAHIGYFNSNLLSLWNRVYQGIESKTVFADNLPELSNNVLGIISQKTWKHIGNAIISELMQLIIDQGPYLYKSEAVSVYWSKSAFRIIYVLLKHDLANTENFRSFFQNPNILRHIVLYAEMVFKKEFHEIIFHLNVKLTQHWYWPFFNDCFKALSKKEENMIDAYALLIRDFELLKQYAQQNDNSNFSLILHELLTFFDQEKYLKEFSELNASTKRSYGKENFTEAYFKSSRISETKLPKEWIVNDVIKILQLLARSENSIENLVTDESKFISKKIFNLVSWVDQFASPGVVESILNNPSLSKALASQDVAFWSIVKAFKMIQISEEIIITNGNARRHRRYIEKKYPLVWTNSRLQKSFFDSYLIQINDLLNQLQIESFKYSKEPEPMHSNLKNAYEILMTRVQNRKIEVEDMVDEFIIK